MRETADAVVTVVALSVTVVTGLVMRRIAKQQHVVQVPVPGRGIRQAVQWIWGKAGRRGSFLAFLALLDVLYGWALATASVRALGHSPDLFLPVHVWGYIWAGVGLFCASGIFMRKDWLQYWAAAVLKALWGMLYADLWLVQHLPDTWVSVVLWLAFSFTVLLVSGWPEYVAPPSVLEIELPPETTTAP